MNFLDNLDKKKRFKESMDQTIIMANLTLLLPQPVGGKLRKTLLDIVENLPADWNVSIVSFHKQKPDLKRKFQFEYLYDHPIFQKKLSNEQVKKEEQWLGRPFPFILNSYYYYEHSPEKKQIYPVFLAQLIYYWREHFTKNKTNAFLSIIECDYPQLTGYEVGGKLGVESIYPAVSRLGKAVVILDRDLHPVFYKNLTKEQIDEDYDKTLELLKAGKPVKMGIVEKRGQFHKNRLNTTVPRAKHHLKEHEEYQKKTFHQKLTYPSTGTVIRKWLQRNMRAIFVPMMYQKADLEANFFVFPIPHFDEVYNSYYHGMHDCFEYIKMVSRALPSGYWLYVKPHPHFNGNDVPIEKAKEVNKLKNVKIIPARTKFKELLDKTKGIITVGTTTGFEAIIHKRPVLVFGNPFYSRPGTVVNLKDARTLPETLMNVIKDPNYGIDPEKRKQFVANYYAHQVYLESEPIVLGDFYFKDSKEAKKVSDAIAATYEYLAKQRKN